MKGLKELKLLVINERLAGRYDGARKNAQLQPLLYLPFF